jgi:hypothetical protein
MTRIEVSTAARVEPSLPATPSGPPQPLTERVLAALPGRRGMWAVIWAFVALLRLGVLLLYVNATGIATASQASVAAALGQVVLGYVILVGLLGTPILVRRVHELDPMLQAIAPARPAASWFGRMTSVTGPIVLAAIGVAVSVPSTLAEFGVVIAIADIVLLGIVLLPIMTFVWAYATLLLGLDRLGRADLQLHDFPQDRALGLGALGSVAMTGFWILVVSATPLLIFAGSDLTALGTTITILTIMVGLFILSMLRLHGQLRAAKARYVTMARSLVADAYAPIRASADLETLQGSKQALDAAQTLAERAEKLLEWPIDERMVAWITVVVTGVATSLVVRFVLEAVGA